MMYGIMMQTAILTSFISCFFGRPVIPPISDLDNEHDRLIEMGPDLDFTTIAIFEACLYKEFDPKKITIQTFKIMMQLRETSSET